MLSLDPDLCLFFYCVSFINVIFVDERTSIVIASDKGYGSMVPVLIPAVWEIMLKCVLDCECDGFVLLGSFFACSLLMWFSIL